MNFKKITIIGLGVMGGSLGLAIKRFCPGVEITGVDLNEDLLDLARTRGAIDFGALNLRDGARDADLIFIAAPIDAIKQIIRKLRGLIRKECLVTDLGSTKMEICKLGERILPTQFIGGHPMTGSELQGIKGADPFLYENAIYLLTPLKRNDRNVKRLARFLEKLGASVAVIPPEMHDEIVAHVSHLPQLLAVALTDFIGEKNKKQPFYKEFAAGGFRDMTRIASSPYPLWHDVLKSNASFVQKALKDLMKRLTVIQKHLAKSGLKNHFERARSFRDKLPIQRKGFIKSLHRIAVSLRDEKGALAIVTSLLAKHTINISDIELLRVREGFGGTFQLFFANSRDAEHAVRILRRSGFESRIVT